MVQGLSASDPNPGHYIQINLGAGDSGGGVSQYSVLLFGNMLSTGSAVADGYYYGPDTDVQLLSESDAITLFGQGSELHLMYKKFRQHNKVTAVYAMPVKESNGNHATGDIVITDTASGDGEVVIRIKGEVLRVAFSAGDTASDIGDLVEAAVNANKNLPVTASNAAGTVTLTAKQTGPRGNLIRFNARVEPTGVTSAASPLTYTALSGGTTEDDVTNALAVVNDIRFYYYAPAHVDGTNLGLIYDQAGSMSSGLVGKTTRVLSGFSGTGGSVNSIATTLNRARGDILALPNSDDLPCEIAANAAAAVTFLETDLGSKHSLNFNGVGATNDTAFLWSIKAPADGSALTRAEKTSLLNSGVTPIEVVRPGVTAITRLVTTYSLNGSSPDYRVRDHSKVTVMDRFADDLRNAYNSAFNGKTIGNDPVIGQPHPGPNVVYPSKIRGLVYRLLNNYRDNSLIEDVDGDTGSKASLTITKETSPSTRFSIRLRVKVVDILNSTATDLDEVSGNQ